MINTLLGGMSPSRFLRDVWHKHPLLIRNAVPGFGGLLSPDDMLHLASRDDVESRLLIRTGRRWTFEHGPFRRADLTRLPAANWTLLVQGVNLHSTAADAFLRRFRFLPYARLDDMMVSLAAPGGGVGPHFDSYDVFLLQARGRRRWRIGRAHDGKLDPKAPLKILRHFVPEQELELDAGDLLGEIDRVHEIPQLIHESQLLAARP